jgi:hypothetical protein
MIKALVRTLKRIYLPVDDWEALHNALVANEIEVEFIVSKVILSQEGVDALAVEDRMEPLVQELCLHASKKLLLDEDYSFKNWDYAGTVSLHINGDKVLVSGDLLKPTSFAKQYLIASLLKCAAQVMALMQKLHAHNPEYNLWPYPYFEGLLNECKKLYEAKYDQ